MTNIEEWIGRTALDDTGEQIGVITQIWVDDDSSEPEWASVKLIGSRGHEALVPLTGARRFGGGRRFAYSKGDIADAPHPAQSDRLGVTDKEQLASYYGAPDTNPDPGPATWVDRLEDAADGATVREIRALLGDSHSAPAAQAPAAPPTGRRFRRKSAPSTG